MLLRPITTQFFPDVSILYLLDQIRCKFFKDFQGFTAVLRLPYLTGLIPDQRGKKLPGIFIVVHDQDLADGLLVDVVLQECLELVVGDGLGQGVHGPQDHCLAPVGHDADNDDGNVARIRVVPETLQDFPSIESGHHEVEGDKVGLVLAGHLQRLYAVFALQDLRPHGLDVVHQQFAGIRIDRGGLIGEAV